MQSAIWQVISCIRLKSDLGAFVHLDKAIESLSEKVSGTLDLGDKLCWRRSSKVPDTFSDRL